MSPHPKKRKKNYRFTKHQKQREKKDFYIQQLKFADDHPLKYSTMQPVCGLNMAERTGYLAFRNLWPYVLDLEVTVFMMGMAVRRGEEGFGLGGLGGVVGWVF